MTGNVAQVFVTDEEMSATLRGVREGLRRGGHLAFEVREPERRAWRSWTREETYARVELPRAGFVESWVEVTHTSEQLVTFRWTYHFERSDEVVVSDSTLRFRDRDQIEILLRTAGLRVIDVRDAPDRPGTEIVFVAVRTG